MAAARKPRDYGRTAMPANLEAAKRLLGESKYAGETTVVINPTDFPSIGLLGHITADLLGKIGFKVDLKDSDWGTVIQRRGSREPVDKGGWSVFHSFGSAPAYATPATSTLVRRQGAAGWSAGPTIRNRRRWSRTGSPRPTRPAAPSSRPRSAISPWGTSPRSRSAAS